MDAGQIVETMCDRDGLNRPVEGTEMASMISQAAPSPREGVRASLNLVADALRLLKTREEATTTWTAREWATKRQMARAEGFLPEDFRQFGDGHPELLNCFYDLGQYVNTARLGNIAVRVVVIRIVNVLVSLGGRKYENRNFAQLFMFLYPLKQLAAAYLREVPVCEDEVRERRVCFLFLEQKLHCLLAIMCNSKFPVNIFATAKSHLDEVKESFIVLDHKQANRLRLVGLWKVLKYERRYSHLQAPLCSKPES